MTSKQALGIRIKEAREKTGWTKSKLAREVGKSRQMIGRYEAGADTPSVEVLGKIAEKLGITEINVNGYRFSVVPAESIGTQPSDQLRLVFDKEYVYPGATVKITPGKAGLTITALAPTATG